MKRMPLFSLLTALLVLSISTVHAQTADEVINKHFEAIGGKDNWRKVQSMKSEAQLSVQGMDIPLTIYQVHNKAMKQEINVMNMTGFSIMRADSGWNYMPFQGQSSPEPVTAEELQVGADGLDIQGDLLDYTSKGHKVELQGKEDVDGTEAFKIKLTRKSGREAIYYFDPATYYMIRSISKVTVNGQEMEQKANMSNFQKLPEGIVVPFTMEPSSIPAPINIKKIEVNVVIPDSVFRPNM